MSIKPNTRPRRLLISLTAGLIVVLAVMGLLHRAFGEDEVRVAKPAPLFVLKVTKGQTVKLTDFKNKALLVCFLATWDNNSQQQMKILNDLQKQHGETNLAVLGFALDQTHPELVKAYAEQHHLTYPLYLADYSLIRDFGGLTAMPTTFVIDKNQNIIQTYVGVTETNVFDDYLKAIAKQ
ncbi:MAG: TlpA disulfide reductase family protein [Verrucomicrobiia bacterium]|jgi:cytochrome c biogenesis protein CcmG/thiol:disulfide interchange protein DsbE